MLGNLQKVLISKSFFPNFHHFISNNNGKKDKQTIKKENIFTKAVFAFRISTVAPTHSRPIKSETPIKHSINHLKLGSFIKTYVGFPVKFKSYKFNTCSR